MTAPATSEARGRLLRLLGAGFGVAVIVGGTLGAGILRTPGEVARHLGSPAWILAAWLLGGLYSLLGALSVTELGAALPRAGGFCVYVRRAFGSRAGFAIGCCDWIGQIAAVAFAAITIGEYAAQLVPALAPLGTAIALGSIGMFAAVHWTGLRVSARTQEITSLLKAVAFTALVVACFLRAPFPSGTGAATAAPAAASGILAAQAIFYTYDGWYSAIYFTEEDRAPGRNLLRAMLAGVGTITAIYVLINAALLAVLPSGELAASTLPAATAAERLYGRQAGVWIVALSLLSLPPLINAVLLMGTRIVYSLARDHGFAPLAHVSAQGTPRTAMVCTCVAAAALVLSNSAASLVAIAGFFYVLNYSSAYLCVWRLRHTEPALPRPYRTWGYPYTTGLVLLISLGFLGGAIAADFRNSIAALALLGTAAVFAPRTRR